MNLYSLLFEHGALDRRFLTPRDGAPPILYREMDAQAGRLAAMLLAAGAAPGDRICVQVEKSPANVALYLASLRAGLVYAPLNTAYTAEEVAYFLDDAAPSLFVCRPEDHAALSPIAQRAGVRTAFALGREGEGPLISAANALPPAPIAPRAPRDLASILYTSGTTGRPKGAMLTHANLAANARTLNALWAFSAQDILLHALPIFHIHGLFVALHTAMLSGAEILFHSGFDLAALRADLPRTTVLMGVPTFYTRLLADPEFSAADCAAVRVFISGSAPLTEETFAAFKARTGHAILERYGMTETGMIASNPLVGERRAGSVGFALPGVDVRITDDQGAAAPVDAAGGVEVRAESVFAGYWRRPEETARAFRDGWFVTGDVGALDPDGRLRLVGRTKDLIIAGGFNIYPIEIERALDAAPGVVESAVIGAPHPDLGEAVVAVIVADPQTGPPDERALARAVEGLARFKQPRRYLFVETLPRNAMGKVQKQRLRAQYSQLFSAPSPH